MNRPLFSVVIPTRSRAHTLRYTLMTCLSQSFDDFEVVVADNASSPETFELVQELNDDRITYTRSDELLPMAANFNRALEASSGEWVTFLGDDDGLAPEALWKLNSVLGEYDVRSVRWDASFYTWPDHLDPLQANKLSMPLSRHAEVRNSTEALDQMRSGRVGPTVPTAYHGLQHRSLIEDAQKTGPVFEGRIPDYFSGVLFASIEPKFLSITEPLSIVGVSGSSHGMSRYINGPRNAVRQENDALSTTHEVRFHDDLPDIYLVCVWVWDAMFRVRDRLGTPSADLRLSPDEIAAECVRQIWVDEPERSDQIAEMRRFMKAAGIADVPDAETLSEAASGQSPPYIHSGGVLGLTDQILVLEVRSLGVKDVKGAHDLMSAIGLATRLTNLQLESVVASTEKTRRDIARLKADLAKVKAQKKRTVTRLPRRVARKLVSRTKWRRP